MRTKIYAEVKATNRHLETTAKIAKCMDSSLEAIVYKAQITAETEEACTPEYLEKFKQSCLSIDEEDFIVVDVISIKTEYLT